MKLVVLGGCGVMGSSIVRDLIKGAEVERVVVADKQIDATKLHVSLQKSDKVSMQAIDVTDYQALVKLFKKNDVVINSVGPFYKFAILIIKAAIEAGVNYLDIMDDYDTTLAAFDLDEAAKEAGLSICIGFGSSPGFGNVVAKYAVGKLDQVEEIRLLWGYALNDPTGPSVVAHMFHALRGDVPQYLDGRLTNVPGGSGGEEVVDFMEPYGKCPVYYLGHPEPITMPRYFKGVKTVVNKGCFLPLWVNELVFELIDRGFADKEPVTVNGNSIAPEDFIVQVMQTGISFKKQVEEYTTAPLRVIVRGRKGDKAVTYVYDSAGRMAPGTAIPASICAQMLARGEIREKGVVPPEACVDPKIFFDRFAERGFRLLEQKTITGEAEI
ncbi:MAG: saccharopine dehydrogenase NADP-binding domain-containing protein [Dehalococcoidia bacterium]